MHASKTAERALAKLVSEISRCRICRDAPTGAPLPHEPRPVLRPSGTARICICSQAPGTRVHASGTPFTDPSGDRLRAWLELAHDEFYDQRRIAIVPMGFCFPGLDAAGGANIHATISDNRIEGNQVTDADRGIDVDTSGNLIIRNSASGNASNYEIAANNVVGVIVQGTLSGAISGATGGAGVGTTDPWANLSF